MLKFLGFVLWTVGAVAAGMWLSDVKWAGKTPLEHVQKAVQGRGRPTLTELRRTMEAALKSPEPQSTPREQHSVEDRDAVKKLIVTRGQQKP